MLHRIRRGMTSTELLVAVGIIALLVAIFAPTVNRARRNLQQKLKTHPAEKYLPNEKVPRPPPITQPA